MVSPVTQITIDKSVVFFVLDYTNYDPQRRDVNANPSRDPSPERVIYCFALDASFLVAFLATVFLAEAFLVVVFLTAVFLGAAVLALVVFLAGATLVVFLAAVAAFLGAVVFFAAVVCRKITNT